MRLPVPTSASNAWILSGSALLLLACGGDRTPVWHEEAGHRWTELRVQGDGAGFTRLAPERTGITASNDLSEERRLDNQTLADGSGVALGDADGDGRVDIYLSRIDGSNVLYRNRAGWRFEDVSEQAGVGLPEQTTTGAVFADVDGDRDSDLLVAVLGGPNALLLNDGTGTFEDASVRAGFEAAYASKTLALADIDGDGDLDLYVANNKTRVLDDMYPPEQRRFEDVVEQRGDEYVVRPEFAEHMRVTRHGNVVRRQELAEPDELYLNDGTGRFAEVSWTEGRFLDVEGRPLETAPRDWGLTARFHDLEGDGDPDLYVCNDFETPDRIWVNDGGGSFRAADPLAIRTTSLACMTVVFSDVDRDGHTDFFTADMLGADLAARKREVPPMPSDTTGPGQIWSRVQRDRNTLQVSRGDGTFADVAWYAGVAGTGWTWGVAFLDVDLDGWEDLLVTTGHAWDMLDGDVKERVVETQRQVHWKRVNQLRPPLRLRNLAFRNAGSLRFEATDAWGFGPEPDVSHGMATGDLDGDGDLDVVVNRLDAPPAVYRNDAGAPRLAVRLRGEPGNTHGIGARVRVRAPGLPEQTKEATAGGLYASGSDYAYAFAAGDAETLAILVEWPHGARSVVEDARPNRLYEIEWDGAEASAAVLDAGESETGAVAPQIAEGEAGAVAPTVAGAAAGAAPTHFRDLTGSLGHRHVEPSFDEFSRQPLLPLRLSQLGPGVSWEDVEGDGDADLLVASGRGGRVALYRNEGDGRLSRVELDIEESEWDQTTVLAVPDGSGRKSLLVGQSNYEASNPDEASAAPSVLHYELGPGIARANRAAATPRTAVEGARSTTGPLALGDVEADGDLDLFVGGRVAPTVYPFPASSRLYRREGGRFVLDEGASRLLEGVGMVSAASFADVEGDGDADLLLALEWGPVRLFVNDGAGSFREATAAWGLDAWPGRWNGLAVGDLDGDGRLDLVVTSWGENTGRKASRERPLLVHAGDFDGNGTVDLLHGQRDPRSGVAVPLEPFAELVAGMPALRGRVPSYAAYAEATLEELLGRAAGRAYRAEAVTLSHTVFWNRGSGFQPQALPLEAQLAPSFHAGVADLDGDGVEDLFLTQNFFATPPQTPRYDAGRSLWLRGDGRGGFEPVPGQVSGIRIYGDPRGAALADYDGDGRVDMAVSQNGAETILLVNEGAAPGVRVRLVGPAGNPEGVGAQVRLEYADGSRGAAREVVAGSGYWSRDGAVQVLGRADGKTVSGVWVRWPGGRTSTAPLEPGTAEVILRSEAYGRQAPEEGAAP